MPHKTILEVHGPRRPVLEALLTVDGAVEQPPQVDGVSFVDIGLGFATAVWLDDPQRTVITVHEPDHRDAVAAAVFARLAQSAHGFDIRPCGAHEDFRYEFDYAS